MPTIFPTHRCFDDVLDHQAELRTRDPKTAARQLIVHGILLAPEDGHGVHAGEPFAHAWVEDDDERRIYEAGILNGEKVWWSADRDEWYRKMHVQAATRYTLHAALILNWQHGHYGPWVRAYAALCGRQQGRAQGSRAGL